jgi:hypothetical protein
MPKRFFFFVGLLIRLSMTHGQAPMVDTVYETNTEIDEVIRYGAVDSSFYDVVSKKAFLYGGAFVETQSMKLKSGIIILDFLHNEVEAIYRIDGSGAEVEYPEFSDATETLTCRSMRMNTATKKAYIEVLKIKQQELFFQMGEAKRYPHEDIHLKKGILTTCDQEEPHYHFLLKRGVVIPEKRIVAGGMNLWISGIPTPIGLPFAIIPQQKERTRGLLFPELVPSSPYGFGIQNLGYFIPINDRLQTSVYASIYSRGSWGLRNELDYSKRYGYTGKIGIGFQQFNNGFPNYSRNNKFTLTWTHNKQARSNPLWQFNSNVNFISDNTSKNNPDPINPDYFKNSFNSDVNVNRLFPGKPLTTGMKISLRQNSISKSIALVSPVITANLTRIFPFKNLIKSPKSSFGKAVQIIGITYNFEAQNKSTFGDSLLSSGDVNAIGSLFFNGIQQTMGIQTTLGLFKNTIKISPNLSLGNKQNFQSIDKSYNAFSNTSQTDTLRGAFGANELNFNLNATTVVYSYYRFIGKKKPILRHLLTPSIGYRYTPKLNNLITKNVGPNQTAITFSPFERSIYTVGNLQASSFISFGVNNSLELKFKSAKDTVTGYKKIRILDQFSITGNFDALKDSFNLSDLALNLRVSPFKWMNFVATGTYSCYSWNTTTGKSTQQFAWKTQQGLGRILALGMNSTFTLSSRKSREILEQKNDVIKTAWNADFVNYTLHPEQAIYFDIPWKLNIAHIYSILANTNISSSNPALWNKLHTFSLNGDVTFTKRWNLASNINLDVKSRAITNMNLSLNRNMHCWALSFFWTPIGGNKSFLLSIRNTSSLFKDAKIEVRKPPAFF